MQTYRRFVSYVYQYENGKKAGNRGFIKVEARGNTCSMQIALKGVCQDANGSCKVFGFKREDGLLKGSLLAECPVKSGTVQEQLAFLRSSMGSAGYSLHELSGVIFQGDDQTMYGTQWDDEPMKMENFQPDDSNVSRQNQETPAQGEMSEQMERSGQDTAWDAPAETVENAAEKEESRQQWERAPKQEWTMAKEPMQEQERSEAQESTPSGEWPAEEPMSEQIRPKEREPMPSQEWPAVEEPMSEQRRPKEREPMPSGEWPAVEDPMLEQRRPEGREPMPSQEWPAMEEPMSEQRRPKEREPMPSGEWPAVEDPMLEQRRPEEREPMPSQEWPAVEEPMSEQIRPKEREPIAEAQLHQPSECAPEQEWSAKQEPTPEMSAAEEGTEASKEPAMSEEPAEEASATIARENSVETKSMQTAPEDMHEEILDAEAAQTGMEFAEENLKETASVGAIMQMEPAPAQEEMAAFKEAQREERVRENQPGNAAGADRETMEKKEQRQAEPPSPKSPAPEVENQNPAEPKRVFPSGDSGAEKENAFAPEKAGPQAAEEEGLPEVLDTTVDLTAFNMEATQSGEQRESGQENYIKQDVEAENVAVEETVQEEAAPEEMEREVRIQEKRSAGKKNFCPFTDGILDNCQRITLDDILKLDPRDQCMRNNRFVQHGYQMFGHLLLARVTRNCQYILGVPGIYQQQEKFMADMYGFHNFKCARRRNSKTPCFGYWYRLIYPPKPGMGNGCAR